MSGWRGTLVLAATVGALAAALYWTRQGPRQDGLTESALDGRALLQAQRLRLRSQTDTQAIEFERRAGGFDVVEPVRDLASEARLVQLASAFDTAQLIKLYEPTDLTPDLLAQTGLDRPRAELEASWQGHTVKLELGAEGPLGHDVYVRKNGGVVFQGSLALWSAVQGTPDDYREHRVFLTSPSDVQTVRVTRWIKDTESRLELERRGDGWRLRAPIEARAQPAATESLVAALVGLRADGFSTGNLNPQPRPDVTLEVDGLNGREVVELWFQGDSGQLLGHQQPRQLGFFVGAPTYRRALEIPAQELRSRSLLAFAPDEIRSLTLDPGAGVGRAAVLSRNPQDEFELQQPVRTRAQAGAVGKLFEAFRLLVAEDLLAVKPDELAQYGLDAEFFRVRVTTALPSDTAELHIGKVDGDHVWMRRADELWVAKVPRKCAEGLRQPWIDYVDRRVWRCPTPQAVQQVRSRRGDVKLEFVKTSDGRWQRAGAAEPADLLGEAVQELVDLDADRALELGVVDGLGEPWEIEAIAPHGVVLQTFSLWSQGERCLVRVPGLEVVYQLPTQRGVTLRALVGE